MYTHARAHAARHGFTGVHHPGRSSNPTAAPPRYSIVILGGRPPPGDDTGDRPTDHPFPPPPPDDHSCDTSAAAPDAPSGYGTSLRATTIGGVLTFVRLGN